MGSSRPADLGPRGRRLWRQLIAGVRDEGRPGHTDLLAEACRTVDLLERIDQELAGSLTVTGSQGQLRSHPLLVARTAYLADLRALLTEVA